MKKRILSIFLMLTMLMSVLCIDVTTVYAVDQAEVNGKIFYSHATAWRAAVEGGGTFKLISDWRASNKDFGYYAVGDEEDYFANGAIRVPEGKSVTIDLNGHSISRNLYYGSNDPVSDGEVIYLERDAKLTIQDTSASGNGRIEDGNSSNGAGGIHAKPGSRIYMYSGAIGYCQSDKRNRGAAVYLDSGAMMFMYGGRIYSNKYTGSNGSSGIFVDEDARFYMYGGSIDNNKSEEEGAVYVNNTYALFQGGVIRDNYAENNGSAVYCYGSRPEVYFKGTDITGNSGGYAVRTVDGVFSDGKICNNSGGGVFVGNGCNIKITGNIQIFGNKLADGSISDVFLELLILYNGNEYAHLLFDDNIKENAKIGVRHEGICDYKVLENVYKDYPGNKYAKYIFSNDPKYRIKNKEEYSADAFNGDIVGSSVLSDEILSIGEDSFITGVSGVKDTNESVSYTCDVDKDTRSVTIHVPQDIDTSALAVGLNTTGVATEAVTLRDVLIQPITPSADTYTDFKTTEYGNTRAYTLLNVDKKTQQNWTITVENDMAIPSYSVTVNSGAGSGTYKIGSSVTVSADTVENKRFVKWSAEGVTLSDTQLSSSSITFTMPDNAVTLTAEYVDLTNTVDITIDEPYGGKALAANAAIKLDDGTTAEVPVSWSPAAEKAGFDSTYNAVITFVSANGFSNNLTVTLNGEVVEPKKPDSKTLVITKGFTTAKAKLLSIPTAEYTAVHGTALNDILDKLPSEIGIVTENEAVSTEGVTWDKDVTIAYDPSDTNEQSFTLDGTITLPEGIDQNNVDTKATIKVTVSEKDRAAAPTSNLTNGAGYGSEQLLQLFTETEDAVIYYTMDGSEPTAESTPYTGAIKLAVDKRDKVYTIKAIAVPNSTELQNSHVSSFKFRIIAPTYPVSIRTNYGTAGLGSGLYHEGDTVTVQTAALASQYVFMNWSTEDIELTEEQISSPKFSFTMPAHKVALTPIFMSTIKKIELNIDAPTKDSALDMNAGYTITRYDDSTETSETQPLTVSWTPANSPAKANTEYTATVVLKPNYPNFIFDDSVTAEVSGASSTECIKNDDGSVTITAVFPATDKLKLKGIKTPSDVLINDLNYYESELLEILPATVDISTYDGKTRAAEVSWDISPL